MGGLLVAWVFPSFQFYLFLVEDLVESVLLKFLQEKKAKIN
jgi:hypothetical protein